MVSRLCRLLEIKSGLSNSLPIAMAGSIVADSQIENIKNVGYIAFGGMVVITVAGAGYVLYRYYKSLREPSRYY